MSSVNIRNKPCKCGSEKKYKRCCMRKEEQKLTPALEIGVVKRIAKFEDGDDFYQRFYFQNMNIRDFVIAKEKRNDFDKRYESVVQNLVEAKYARQLCYEEIEKHKRSIENKVDGIFSGTQITVNNPIDVELNMFFKDFMIRTSMAIDGLIKLCSEQFGYNIGFLFSDSDKEFEKGANLFKLERTDPRFESLSAFIKLHRNGWYKDYRNLRIQIEHHGFKLEDIKYYPHDGITKFVIPKYNSSPVTDMLDVGLNNLVNLCEEILVFIMSLELPNEFVIWRIPDELREKYYNAHYKVSLQEFPEAHISAS